MSCKVRQTLTSTSIASANDALTTARNTKNVGSISSADANKVATLIWTRLAGPVTGFVVADTFAALPQEVRNDAITQCVIIIEGIHDGLFWCTYMVLEDS